MDWLLKSQDLMALATIPVSISVGVQLFKNWRSVFDLNLTDADRVLLQRVALFIVMPIIVLFHECGHAAATLLFGGQIQEFHYGFLWGYVIPSGSFTQWQILIIYLAGNLVELICGLIAFAIAFISISPPVVALSIYVAFWSVAGTLIFYAVLSLIGAYGDWIAIYSSPEHAWVIGIGLCHAFIVAVIIWMAYAEAPLLWFVRKTRPDIVRLESELLEEIRVKPTIDSYLNLGWLYFKYDVYRQASRVLKTIDRIAPGEPAHLLLKGYILSNEGQQEKAIESFRDCASNSFADSLLRSRAFMAIGYAHTQVVEISARGGKVTPDIWNLAIDAYTTACEIKGDLGDPHYYRALLYIKQGLDSPAEEDLITVLQSQCLDTKLFDLAQATLVRLKTPQVPAQ